MCQYSNVELNMLTNFSSIAIPREKTLQKNKIIVWETNVRKRRGNIYVLNITANDYNVTTNDYNVTTNDYNVTTNDYYVISSSSVMSFWKTVIMITDIIIDMIYDALGITCWVFIVVVWAWEFPSFSSNYLLTSIPSHC